MTYIKTNWKGDFEAELITKQELDEWKKTLFENLKETFASYQGNLDALEKRVKKLLNEPIEKRQQIENEHLVFFEQEMESLKKDFKKLNASIPKAEKDFQDNQKAFLEKTNKQLSEIIENLDSEILKKVPSQVKSEDLDTLKILQGFYDRIKYKTLNSKDTQKIIEEIENTIPKLNISPKIRKEILRVRDRARSEKGEGEEKYKFSELEKILREIIDSLNAGMELNDIKVSSDKKEPENINGNYIGGKD
jgi:hypothetical protein